MMRSWRGALAVYLERRVLVILFLGFSSGLPLLLVYSTLSAWLKDADVSLTAIGLFSWASLAYALKFLWAPAVDKVPLPGLTGRLGQRRGWLLAAQVAVVGTMIGMGGTDPAAAPLGTALWAVLLAFASATQDIVIDAYRVESLDAERYGAGAANYVLGYRVAMLAAGAGALILADEYSWAMAYWSMAGLMAVGIVTTLVVPEPEQTASPESQARSDKARAYAERIGDLPAALRGPMVRLYDAVVCPFAEFMGRPHWIAILCFVALYKYGEALLGVMANPFYLDIGFSKEAIGLISKGFGFGMTIFGGFVGGLLVARLGILRALMWSGIFQCLANLVFAVQALVGANLEMLAVSISVENVTAAMATSAFVAYLSSLTNVAYTATQFALLTSLMNFARIVFASGGGWLADQVGWAPYFVLTTVAAVPGLVILVFLFRWFPPEPVGAEAPPAPAAGGVYTGGGTKMSGEEP